MSETAADTVDKHAWIPNIYARCECSLSEEFGDDPAAFPICTFFEDAGVDGDPEWDADTCKACRHGEDCHKKGHEPKVKP